ncbi:MAG: segregation/condensation protein A [Deltaproteobacteria bacterium]|nr:segregation/condensation protein A [Deltaproteobacteria bacterium]
MNPRFQLDVFEGPLDLLLHLIKKNEVDVHDIPIATITDQYLAYLQLFEQLNLDLAGEYLVMAATLMQIKSRLLLPPVEGEEDEEEDPRLELVQQLEEYQRFRAAAAQLGDRDVLDRDVFRRVAEAPGDETRELPPLRALDLADLIDALREILRRLPEENAHEILGERIAIADRIPWILERLRDGEVEFARLFDAQSSRREVVSTFLALLELVKMRAVRALQSERFGPILLALAVPMAARDA